MKNKMNERLKNNFKLIVFAFLISIIFLSIMLIKGYTSNGWSLVYFWTIFVTTFMSSRVIGSIFYKIPSEKDESYNPLITFIIPSKNEEKAIYHTISSCFAVNYPKKKIEVIAINDGSTDNTLNEMNRAKKDFNNFNLKIINWKINKGKREGMIYGFRKAKGEIIIQLDSDSYPDPEGIRYLISPFKDKKIYGVVGHTLPSNPDTNILTKIQYAYYFMSFRALKSTESMFDVVFCCSGCYSGYRKNYVVPHLDKWSQEKFFGKKYSYGDDRSLTNLGLKLGYKTVYSSEAKAFTVVPEKFKQLYNQQKRWKKGWFINSMKASRWIYKRDGFVSLTYFFPLIFLTLLTPIIAIKSLIINPIFYGISPIFYIMGILLISTLCYVHFLIYSPVKKYGKYMFLWSILNMTVLSFILIPALLDLNNTKWVTR